MEPEIEFNKIRVSSDCDFIKREDMIISSNISKNYLIIVIIMIIRNYYHINTHY